MSNSVLFRARVTADRLKKAEKVFARFGMKTSDAFNIFLAQVELRKDMPFSITSKPVWKSGSVCIFFHFLKTN